MKCTLSVIMATWFFAGLIPPFILKGMAGAYGAVASLPLCFLALWAAERSIWYYLIITLAIFIIGIQSGGSTAQSTYLALGLSLAWLVVSLAYFLVSSARKGQAIVPTAISVPVKE